MTSSRASSQTSASDAEQAAFAAWCDGIGIPSALARAFARLPVRDTFDGLLRYSGHSPFRGAEFSLRAGSTARVAMTTGETTALASLLSIEGPRHGAIVARAEAALARRDPPVDALVGYGERGSKLYLLRPHETSHDAFERVARAWAEVDDESFDFIGVDLLPGDRLSVKVYRQWGDRVTSIRDGRDVTEHHRCFDLALDRLALPLRRAFEDLVAQTRRRLVPTHLSHDATGAQTLYYQVDADV